MTTLSHIQLLVNLYLIGVDNPVLDFSGSSYHDFSLQGGGYFYAENVTFYNISVDCSIEIMIFNNCIFTSGSKAVANKKFLYITYISKLIINNCLFHNNGAGVLEELILITNVAYVDISGCEFYLNTGQTSLIMIISYEPFNLELDNCHIYDNEVGYATIAIQSYNSESVIAVTNCLFSNNTAGELIFAITINRLYMSNVNLISNKIKSC